MKVVLTAVRFGIGLIVTIVAAVNAFAQTAPVVYNMPAGITVDYGNSIYIGPSISGTGSITYQWKKGGVAISGQTSSAYSKSNLTTADNGQYTLTATNSGGSSTSSIVVVTVNPATAPTITNLPAGLTLDYGSYFSLSPIVSGSQPITFQWKKDGVNISGATSNYYSVTIVTTADSGQYTLSATNSVGTVTSTVVVVTVNAAVAPKISGLPAGTSVGYGNYLSLYPTIVGTTPITYQWKKDGVNISGAASGSYSVSSVTLADSGQYTLTATNAVGSVTSAAVVVTVDAATAPVIGGLGPTAALNFGDYFGESPYVSGSAPITYQWKKDGVNIAGATSAYYSQSGMTPADSGEYSLTATNVAGSATSKVVVTVAAATAPVISGLPAAVNAGYGETISISPSITGASPITYQWKKAGVNISGATSAYFSKSNATQTDAGQYTLTATNSVGSVTSAAVTVTVNAAIPPTLSNLPPVVIVNYGDTLNLYSSVGGTFPVTYQWKKDGIAIPGTNSYYYSKSGATPADSGQYTLTATNSVGSVTSSVASVTVNAAAAPTITNLPTVMTLSYGDSFNFYPTVSGTYPITYQWKKDGVSLSGQISSSFYLYGATPADSGQYTLTATNSVGTVTSTAVAVTVNAAVAPTITNFPSTLTLNYGDSMSLSPTISGTQPMTLQWKKAGAIIPGANSNYYSVGSVMTADSGQYTLTATNAVGTATSTTLTVTVNAAIAPVIVNLPTALTLSYGGSFYFSPTVSGTLPMTLQWKKAGAVIPGANGSGYSKGGLTPSDSGQYTLTATNVAGTVTSTAITLTVNAAIAPSIFEVPPTTTVDYGTGFSLYPITTGTAPITFQWKKDGAVIPENTSATFYKSYATTADSGQYTLTATNLAGTATSTAMSVTVNPAVAPTIVQQPSSATVLAGTSTVFTVSATGTNPLNYQWYFNDDAIFGANNYTLSIDNVQSANTGSYKVVISNPGGTITSDVATLTVSSPLGIISVATGSSHSLFIRSDGGLWGMGSNYSGQLGDGSSSDRRSPGLITTGVIAAAAGGGHSLFIKTDGTLWATGANTSGQLGDGTTTYRSTPVQISTGVVSVYAGNQHSLFIKSDGSLWAMGNNDYGQLGDGTGVSSSTPIQVASDVVFATAGSAHSFFIKADGTVWAMGLNGYYGQLGDGSTQSRLVPTLIASDVALVSAGGSHSLFIKTDGTLWAAGYNGYGEFSGGTTGYSQTTPIQVGTGVVDVSAGTNDTLFIKSDGTLWGAGYNGNGQLGDNTYQHSVPVQLAASVALAREGNGYSLYITSDGSLWGTGYNYNGQIGYGNNYAFYVPVQITGGPLAAPAAPSGVAATDGTLIQKTRITWTPTLSAMWYEVWRSSTNNKNSATRIASKVPFALFFDTTATAGSTYFYWIKAVNPTGASAFSGGDAGSSAIAVSPSITAQPVGQTVAAGAAVSFTISATGNPMPTYQWRKNGVNIAGATGSSYVISSVPASAAGIYSVVVTNSTGTATSSNAILAVKTASGSDFNSDGQRDILWQNTVTGERFVWLMNGTSHVGGAGFGIVDTAWTIAATADFNADGNPDLLWQNTATGERYVWFMSGLGHVGGASLGVIPVAWSIVAATDFNGDGKPDILWQNTTTGERYIWFMNGVGHISDTSLGAIPTAWSIAAAADFNSDGKPDILWQNTTTGERYIWFMNGAGHVSDLSLGIVDVVWSIASAVDFNNDGQTDILWQNTSTGQRYLWLMNGAAHQADFDLGLMSTNWKIVR